MPKPAIAWIEGDIIKIRAQELYQRFKAMSPFERSGYIEFLEFPSDTDFTDANDLREHFRNAIYRDNNFWDRQWVSILQRLQKLLDEFGERYDGYQGLYYIESEAYSWYTASHINHKYIQVETAQELLDYILPDYDADFEIFDEYTHFAVRIRTGGNSYELYYIYPDLRQSWICPNCDVQNDADPNRYPPPVQCVACGTFYTYDQLGVDWVEKPYTKG